MMVSTKGRAKRVASKGKSSSSTMPPKFVRREDLSSNYDCPFPIFSDEEGIRYETISRKPIVIPRYFDYALLTRMGLKSKIDEIVGRMGLNFIAHGKYQVYKELTREFYTTLNYASKNEKAISFRIKGVDYSIGYDFMNQKLKLPKGGIRGCPSNFDVNRVWKQLTGEDSVDLQQAPNGLIIEPSYLIFHKFLCHSICGKKESNRVTKDDLLVLDYLVRHSAKSVDFIHLIFKSMMTMATSSKVALGNGHLVTCIALLHSAIDEDDLHKMECLGDAYLNETMLRKADILDMDGELMNVKDRNCYLIKTGQPRRGKGRKAEIEDDCDEDEDNVSRELETENGQDEVVRDDVGIDQPREEEVRRPRKPKRRGAFEEEVLSLLNETKSRLTNIETSIEEIKREQRSSHRRWKACFGTLGAHDPSPPHTPES